MEIDCCFWLLLYTSLLIIKVSSSALWDPLRTNSYHNFYPSIIQNQDEEDNQDKARNNYDDNYELPSAGYHQCSLHKLVFTQHLQKQYVSYKHDLTVLKEFTLCMWVNFHNHSNDHSLFSYSVDGQPTAILSWVSNTIQSSFISLAIDGHTFYRLNYPLKVFQWYHVCQSWNGHTGEWQLWVNGERVGRGFHNRLVGHKIRPGGIALSGQNQPIYHPEFLFSHYSDYNRRPIGMQGELTMLQLYNVALTAGKAYVDHKHHHVHLFDHNGLPITTTIAPVKTPKPTMASHPLLTGNQINPMLQLNLGLSPAQIMLQDFNNMRLAQMQRPRGTITFTSHRLYKRDHAKSKRDTFYDPETGRLVNIDGAIPQDSYPGLAMIGENNKVLMQQRALDKEPAEYEVLTIMNICTGCDYEPFEKALVLSWRSIPKKLFAGTVYALANPQCKRF